ncbi:ribbon-helix-helix domain-containing protein [Cyanobium sp. ATX-6F1]|uniref:ribbon-helix-helix domain-containing protein n=1 Tax=Cyanobium sp. ATX-6F1 TaxID=3137388 RepID=UPI0039BE6894
MVVAKSRVGHNTQFKAPARISITIPESVNERLIAISREQGRSLSNLAAYLLEWAISNEPNCHAILSEKQSSE